VAVARERFLSRLTAELLARTVPHTLRVGIDGPDAAGKTTLADELVDRLRPARPVIRLSVDQFHRPQSVRHQRGTLSPEGYYRDSFDHETIAQAVLHPLGPGGDGRYLTGAFDYGADRTVDAALVSAPAGAVLLFDGVFLLRPELRSAWDLSIYLHVEEGTTLSRALVRDRELFGSADVVEARYRQRYLPGQRLYRQEARPAQRADVLVDMTDPLTPVIMRWPG
jgi:uridine kinase